MKTIDRRLAWRLAPVAARIRQVRLWTAMAAILLVAAVAGGAVYLTGRGGPWSLAHVAVIVAVAAGLAVAIGAGVVWRSLRDPHAVAARIEARFPDLDSRLLTAVEQQPKLPHGRFGFLQESVIQDALLHAYRHCWCAVVPAWRMCAARAATAVAVLALAGVVWVLARHAESPRAESDAERQEQVALVSGEFSVAVEPGDTEVERGTSLMVLARFQGRLPADATLVFNDDGGDSQGQRLPMSKSLDDPVFAARIAAVDAPLNYRVEFAGQETGLFHVTVFSYPALERADARLVYPAYTAMAERLVQDVRHVSAVEGTKLTLICHLNKRVAAARLVEKDGETLELAADDPNEPIYSTTIAIDRSRRWKLHLADDEGRANQLPPEFVVTMIPNQPPDVKLVLPSRDVQVSPIEELQLAANAWDDFGLNRYGVSYSMGGSPPQDLVLGESQAGKQRVPIEHLVAFEELDAQPAQLMSYYFWAEDTGPDGNVRRTSSDMYFAEVRHFEEIFRQGQQPPGGQNQQQQNQQQGGQNAQAAEQLAEMQKQIINATWNLIRRENGGEVSSKFADDVQLVLESQQAALEQAAELAGNVEDAQSQAHVKEVAEHMQAAIEHLTAASAAPSAEPLSPALAAEQAAYQALLKLRAREHEVIRSNQRQQQQSRSQASQSSANRAQQQLQQLELKEDENRYETEQTALPQEDQQQREDRQVLNRLRELARRQNDLNKRIKELQSALDEAASEQEKDDIRRQLKRLRDEQQEILRDTDELKSRMEQPENQERMADERQQLEQTRENLRQSSEALEEGQVTRAAAEGTRAEDQFENLREEFRRRAANQFSDEMRNMRRQSQQLADKENELAERLDELANPDPSSNSLRETQQPEQIAEALQAQQQRLRDLLDRMQETVERAETAEPLLADQLYDSIRNAEQKQVGDTLDETRRSLNRGILDDARQQERVARQGIDQLNQGVQRAAENILGDETETLRRAREEVERLARELKSEIARANPQGDEPQGEDQTPPNHRAGNPADRQNQEDRDNPEGRGQPGPEPQDQPRENQNNPSQRGNGQPGQDQPNESPREDGQPAPSPPQDSPQDSPNPPRDGSPPSGRESPNGQPSPRPRPSLTDTEPTGSSRSLDTRGGRDDRPYSPLSGGDFLDWSDRLRDVEEMLDDPDLRAEAARIRDRAKGIRSDVKRHAKSPNWDFVRETISQPLAELQQRINDELLRRTSADARVPLDRDPVPPKFEQQVRRYYENLGKGE